MQGKNRKRLDDDSPMPDYVIDPDECTTSSEAYAYLKSALAPPRIQAPLISKPVTRLNIRLTWAVVADGSVSHRARIEGVVKELRKIGLEFG